MKQISNLSVAKAVSVALFVSVALLAPVGCDSNEQATAETPKDPWYFADLPAPRAVSPDSLRPFTLVERARYGTWDGIGAIDAMNHMVATDSFVVTQQFRSCEHIVFARGTGKPLRIFGRCGRGPDGFQNMNSGTLAVKGDSLLIFDSVGRNPRVGLYSFYGNQFWTASLDTSVVPLGRGVWKAAPLNDSLLLLAISLPAHQARNGNYTPELPKADYLRLYSSQTNALVRSRLKDGPAVAELSISLGRTPMVCVTGSTELEQQVFAVNTWIAQLVAFRASLDGEPVTNLVPPFTKPFRAKSQRYPGRIEPIGTMRIACGDSAVLVSHRAAWNGERIPDNAELFVFWPQSGTYGLQRVAISEEGLLGTLIAATGNRFFFYHGTRFEYPVIIEYELQ